MKFVKTDGTTIDEPSVTAVKGNQKVGKYTLDPNTGTIVFTPEKGFVGQPDPITIQVTGKNGQPVKVVYTPVVTKVTPQGFPATSKGEVGKPQHGTPTFTPEPDFRGQATGVEVERQDINGTPARGAYTPTVVPNYVPTVPEGVKAPDTVPYENPEKPGLDPVIPYIPGKVPVTPNGNPLKPVDPAHPEKGYVAPPPADPFTDKPITYKDNNEDPVPTPPSRETVTTFVDENGNTVGTPELGTQEPKKIPGYEFVKTTTDAFGNPTHHYRKIEDNTPPTTKVITSFVDPNGNAIVPSEDGTHPGKDIPGYKLVKTVVDEFGNTTHTYEKVENGQTPVVPNNDQPDQEKPQKPEVPSHVDTQVTPSTPEEVLPNTGEATEFKVFNAAAMAILAGLGLAIPGKKEEQE